MNLLVNRGAEMTCDALESPSQSGLLPGRLIARSVVSVPADKRQHQAKGQRRDEATPRFKKGGK